MNKLIVSVLLILSLSAHAQTWTPVNGRYSYSLIRFDSLVYWKGGPTSTRPAPSIGNYLLRYNTDSAGFEYSNGNKWLLLAIKVPSDFYYVAYPDTLTRDTTITIPCGTVSTVYSHYHLPQFIGFRTRVYSGTNTVPGDPSGACLFGPFWSAWNSSTGDLWVYGVGGIGGTGSLDLQVTAY